MRLVDADALLAELHQYDDDCAFKDEFEYGLQQRLDTCIYAVEDAPTVDAVEVVRCKNCKYWRRDTDHTCKEHSLVSPMLADGFCSRGERKDGDEHEVD